MRPSPLRHPVAVLRQIIGLGQHELADLVGCSRRTIQAVELLHLPLSESLAKRVTDATGVSTSWLLKGDPSVVPYGEITIDCMAPPFRSRSSPKEPIPDYDKAAFEWYRANLEDPEIFPLGVPPKSKRHAKTKARDAELLARVEKLLKASRENRLVAVIRWRLEKFLDEQIAEFDLGGDRDNLAPVGGKD